MLRLPPSPYLGCHLWLVPGRGDGERGRVGPGRGEGILEVAEGVVGLLWLLVERDEGLRERLEDALLLEVFAELLSLGVDHVRAPRGGRGVPRALDGGGQKPAQRPT